MTAMSFQQRALDAELRLTNEHYLTAKSSSLARRYRSAEASTLLMTNMYEFQFKRLVVPTS